MIKFLLWCILLVLCWPIALAAVLLYPLVWLILLPFRLLGIVVSGVLDLIWTMVMLPASLVRKLLIRFTSFRDTHARDWCRTALQFGV